MSNEEANRQVLKKLIEKYPHVKLFKNQANDLRLKLGEEQFNDLNLNMDPPVFLKFVEDFVRLMGLSNLS